MNINEFFLMAFMTVMTAANFFIYKLTRDKYLETMQRIWNWESYIRRWLKDELKCSLQQG